MSPSKHSTGTGTGKSFFFGEAKPAAPSPSKHSTGTGTGKSFFAGTFHELDPGEDTDEEVAAEKLQALSRGRIVRNAKRLAEEEDAIEEKRRQEEEASKTRGILADVVDEEAAIERNGQLIPAAATNALDSMAAVGGWFTSFLDTSGGREKEKETTAIEIEDDENGTKI